MPDDRLFHKRLGHSEKVNALSDLEDIVWRTYIQAADDFGVMRFSALPLQDFYDRLARVPDVAVMQMLQRVVEVGLIRVFSHQGRAYCYQHDWQDFQKVRYPLASSNPRIPGDLLAACTLPTQWLHTLWPGGGGRKKKLTNWAPDEGWNPPDWTAGSGNGSRTVPERTRARVALRPECPIPVPVPIPVVSTNQLELLPPALVHTTDGTNLPAHSRRPVETLLKTQHAEPEQATSAVAQAGGVAAALQDHRGGDRAGTDDLGQRVEGTDPRSPGLVGVRAAGDDRADSSSHVSRREGAREAEGSAAAAAPAASTSHGSQPRATDDAGGSSDGPSEGQRLLQATIDRLREQLRADVPREDRHRRITLARSAGESDGRADQPVERVDDASSVEADVAWMGPRRRGAVGR